MPHRGNGAQEIGRIGDGKRAGFADADEGLRLVAARDLLHGRMRDRKRLRGGGLQHDAVERRRAARAAASSASARAPSPVTTISAARSRRSMALRRAMWHVHVLDSRRRDGGDQPVGLLSPVIITRQQRQSDQVLRRHRIVIRRRLIGGGRGADNETLGVNSGEVVGSVSGLA